VDPASAAKLEQAEQALRLRGDVLDQKIDRIAPARTAR
jgi:hypothetical protein